MQQAKELVQHVTENRECQHPGVHLDDPEASLRVENEIAVPSVLPTISEITTRIKVIGRLTRKPVMICGEQAGSITCHIVCHGERPKVLAV